MATTWTAPRTLTRLLPRQLTPPQDPKVGMLAGLGLFDGVPVRVLSAVAPLVEHVDVPAGQQLLTEGGVVAEAFVLVAGTARASLRGRTLGHAGPGELLGDLALLRSGRAPVSWTAETDVVVLVLGPRELHELLRRCPLVADRLHGLADTPPNR